MPVVLLQKCNQYCWVFAASIIEIHCILNFILTLRKHFLFSIYPGTSSQDKLKLKLLYEKFGKK